jgi:VanZ family protein
LRLRRFWLVAGWLLVLLIVYLSLRPGEALLPETISDKLQHVLAYAVLMLWFGNLYLQKLIRWRYAVGFVLLGVVLEFIQLVSGYRSFDQGDMVADAMGVAVGWLLAPPRGPGFLAYLEQFLMSRSV